MYVYNLHSAHISIGTRFNALSEILGADRMYSGPRKLGVRGVRKTRAAKSGNIPGATNEF